MAHADAHKLFLAHVELAVWQLLAWLQRSIGEAGLRQTLADHPFLNDWLASALARLGGEPDWPAGAQALADRIAALEGGARQPHALAASAVCGTGFAGRLALVLAGLPEEDSRFGGLFAALQAPLGRRRPCAELLDQVFGEAALAERLAGAGWLLLQPAQAARAERLAQVPEALWRVLRGDVKATFSFAPGLRLQPAAGAGAWDELAVPADLLASLRALPPLLGRGELHAVALRAGPGGDGARAAAALAGAFGRGLLVIDTAAVAAADLALAGPLAAATGALPLCLLDPTPGESVDWPPLLGYRGPRLALLGDSGRLVTPEPLRCLNLALPPPDAAQRTALLARYLPHAAQQAPALAARFRLAPEWLRQAAAMAAARAALAGRQALSDDDFAAACRDIGRPLLDGLAQWVDGGERVGELACGPATAQQLAELERRCRHRDWAGGGVRALFSGPSGTGKTLAAGVLAATLGLDLYRVDLASVVNKYIGETEKNLHRVLSRAEALDVVLLLDEGDALLGRRTDVKSANDRYANLETNYLLTRLEAYRGIVIVTSNAADHIDSAFQRRMDVVVGFQRPQRPERERLWQLHLPPGHGLDWDGIEQLAARCALSGAQIGNACRHAALSARRGPRRPRPRRYRRRRSRRVREDRRRLPAGRGRRRRRAAGDAAFPVADRAMSETLRSPKGPGPAAKAAAPPAPAPEREPQPLPAGGAMQHAGRAPSLLQRKVEVGAADDPLEQEADQVARKVTSGQAVKPGEITPLKPGAVARAPAPAVAAAPAAMNAAAEQAVAGRGAGAPMAPAVQGPIESALGADLSHVRVHDDGAARDAASALQARAFAHGSDIWLGPGESPHDLGLMAHEATHVVQQAGGVQRLMRTAKGGGDDGEPTKDDVGVVGDDCITFKSLRVPDFKAKGHRGALYKGRTIRRDAGYKRGTPDQTGVWDKSIDSAKLRKRVAEIAGVKEDAQEALAIRHKTSQYHVIGTLDEMVETAKRPKWARDGQPKPKDVDHIVELQVSGWPSDGWANTAGKTGNMELMDSRANQDSGRSIARDVQKKINATRAKWPGSSGKGGKKVPTEEQIRRDYELQFTTIEGSGDVGDVENYWTWSEVSETQAPLADFEKAAPGKTGGSAWTLFPTTRGGMPKQVAAGKRKPDADEADWFKPFVITDIDLQKPGEAQGKNIGKIGLDLSQDVKNNLDGARGGKLPSLTVTRLDALPNAGAVMNGDDVLSVWRRIHAKGLSPIELRSWEVDPKKGFVAYGSIITDVPMLQGLAIDFRVIGNRVEFFKLIDTGSIALPGPVQVTGSSLEVFAGTEGVGVRGDAWFEIDKVGAGRVGGGARVSLRGKPEFEIDGEFSFDSELFDQNKIEAWYREGQFGAKGLLTIEKEGKVKGLRQARVDAKYEAGRLEAHGKAELSVPGVKEADLQLTYSEAQGLNVEGRFELKNDIPGIRGGSGRVQLQRGPDGAWTVSASGKAQPKIPGVDAEIAIAYDDGALTLQGQAAYEKGMLKGMVQIGASNRPIGPDGQPAGPPGKKFTAWGGGSLELQIAPWLKGTVGVTLLPNGEIEVLGNIALPSTLDLFPEKALHKNLLSIGMDIPIVGVAVAGQRIGIFANIGGGLDLDAGFGPGQLTGVNLGVRYNPAKEDETTVSGGAMLRVPAHAGLRLYVKGALGAGIPIVSASAGLEVGGALGIAGAMEASVQIDWSPAKGLKLAALGEIYAEPKLRFDITGFAKVEADLFITTIELYNERWQLAAFEYGSGLRFGVRFPISYEEGKPFELSLDQMQFQVPDIDPMAVLSDLVAKVT